MRRTATAVLIVLAAAGCGDTNLALERQSQARHISADLLIRFTKATEASNRAVMATSDETAASAAREADEARGSVQQDIDALAPILTELNYTDEVRLLETFVGHFAAYNELDRRILDLVVLQTNLKAQRLAFGPAAAAADDFQSALAAMTRGGGDWRVNAHAATALAAVREIQAVQAPHIADPDDAPMAAMEKRMSAAEATARRAIDSLGRELPPASRPPLVKAATALDRFLALNVEIVALSRSNTNVRSLALSLDEKRRLVAPCEVTLRALRDALARRGYPSGRL